MLAPLSIRNILTYVTGLHATPLFPAAMLIRVSLDNIWCMAGCYSLDRISHWNSNTGTDHLDPPFVCSQTVADYVDVLGSDIFRCFHQLCDK